MQVSAAVGIHFCYTVAYLTGNLTEKGYVSIALNKKRNLQHIYRLSLGKSLQGIEYSPIPLR